MRSRSRSSAGTRSDTTTAGRSDQFVYIAGPMRGYDKFNFPAFDAARDRFTAMKWHVISPADIDRADNKDENLTAAQVSDQRVYVYRD
jgi:hypothetical protein